ncbi:hypothetical protein EASG3_00126 [Escherichia phage vB_EcoS_EASG3]|uniref:Uncharacterized protein n=1 Tax=Escherichia phage vB_EcoS_HASG4 TaxID=2508175 RepID=A0A482N759_9CAUD|nr:hypothetical protein HASG4_00126 [Escherichia phage vB_EcoS_HASG4]QBQ81642.1 hypothetical protein EASG3_00126 [Escherichia phage vB_EcoS_EASG3]
MKVKPYIIVSTCGSYQLAVETIEEAIFAATGDYSRLEGVGYPSIMGNWVETNLDVNPYNSDYEDEEEVRNNIEFVYKRILSIYEYQGSPTEYVDITEVAKKRLKYVYANFSNEDLETVAVEFNND